MPAAAPGDNLAPRSSRTARDRAGSMLAATVCLLSCSVAWPPPMSAMRARKALTERLALRLYAPAADTDHERQTSSRSECSGVPPKRSQMPDSTLAAAEAVDAKVLLNVLAQVKGGDFSARMPLDWTGLPGKVADGFNDVIIANQVLEAELARVSRVVGKQGELSQRVVLGGSTQSWSGSVESVHSLIADLVRPTSETQRVVGAVGDGA